MAGNGPTRKTDDTRARRNKDGFPLKVVEDVTPDAQPALPQLRMMYLDALGRERSKRIAWPEQTRKWWKMWADSRLSDDFTATDWSALLDTARLHAEYWRGNLKVVAELRLREAKFGATPEDRARLRISFAMAKNAENPPAPPAPSGPVQLDEPDSETPAAVEVPRGPRRLVG